MTGEEVVGPAGPKVVRLLYFVGAGFMHGGDTFNYRRSRPLRRYHEAITYYEKALALSTRSLSTYAGLAYTYHLQDNLTAAITSYHKALWLKADDQFYTEMLTLALVDECRHGVESKTDSRQNNFFIY